MKLSNIAIIFIVIALPLLLILSYYISLQIDTINLQTSYNSKLLDSTKEAIEALEINTVEWNDDYQATSDSKRRDITASINTFTTSLANNLGVAGTSKDYMISNIPAIVYTLYDGFYIYSPTQTKVVIKDDKGVAVFMKEEVRDDHRNVTGYDDTNFYTTDKGKILYEYDSATGGSPDGNYYGIDFTLDVNHAKTEIKHILKPFMAYSEPIYSNKDREEVVINYTLDNYVTVYCKDDQEAGEPYVAKSGFLNIIDGKNSNKIIVPADNFEYGSNYNGNLSINGEGDITNLDATNPIRNITFGEQTIQPEYLTETIVYRDSAGMKRTDTFNYVYEAEKNTKIYYDAGVGRFFRLDNLNKVYIEDLTEPLYKKCLIPVNSSGNSSYKKLYRSLARSESGEYLWYAKDPTGRYELIEQYDKLDILWDNLLYNHEWFTNPLYDYSALNYCVETYVYTDWFNRQNFQYINPDGTHTQITINDANDADSNGSNFSMHKKDVIKNLLRDNLKQAITSYSSNSDENFKIPELTENEWDQVVSNVSIITFLQNIPIGLKYYNNYSIATSTQNREFVNKNELYFYNKSSDNPIYHEPYCTEYTDSGNDLIGYRSVDYIYKYYNSDDNDDELKYYFQHTTNAGIPVKESCYKCLVQRSLEEDYEIQPAFKKSYYTTLARERYLQAESITIEQSDVIINKAIDKDNVDYGTVVEYTITIRNRGSLNDTVKFEDTWTPEIFAYVPGSISMEATPSRDMSAEMSKIAIVDGKIECSEIYVDAGETITIKYKATVIGGNIGDPLENTAKVLTNSTGEEEIAHASVFTKISKKVTTTKTKTSKPISVVLVLDDSGSIDMAGARGEVKGAGEDFENMLKSEFGSSVVISVIAFGGGATQIPSASSYGDPFDGGGVNGITTNYPEGLKLAWDVASSVKSRSGAEDTYIVFMSDGCPTADSLTPGATDVLEEFLGTLGTIIGWFIDTFRITILNPTAGGWMECVWESENVYRTKLLLANFVSDVIKGIVHLADPSFDWNPTFPDAFGVARSVWKRIMTEFVYPMRGDPLNAKMITVYFNTGDGNKPEYGLKQMGVDGAFSADAGTGDINSRFADIASRIISEHNETITHDSVIEIILEDVSKITDIKINGISINTFNPDYVNDVKNAIKNNNYDSATDIGTLNLNDPNIPYDIFHGSRKSGRYRNNLVNLTLNVALTTVLYKN